ncbi:substrate binding protein, putative [Trichomonas vaginalis G3]|uniref:Substrate binding protein, putative n=3 Tax=Trichomonas vaginalis (strain ATCC PRA-98 / G3) TaxID=412133 RepID=A2FXA3_TRIV3|nr:repellent protein 1 family [Trichomonas vaginalis G3]XP_051109799.1 repellent protein 1 family [Trichomonas vaginalis G3]EAX65577.1 substrate binding protein, putative [Trichomonas vaginalis G3]EAX70160.1 substrate binding protein, putative [Trichomonas vaginalis G3]EAX71872.1 substrate binding protein, putative [Trichomonas vaginalis G3]EAX90455.1 substrate binding protein, putative [Trichomonas vaginalis G3]KAI5482173.1 repellent protein 1 family [Trichomonas vaginalis G3]|eukprot:XP_001278507.1 substrate binding protein [Trichomonas vaginalis G3]
MSSSSSSREPSPSMKQTLPNDYGAPIEYFLRAAQWQRAVSPRLGVPPAPVKNSIWSSPYIRYGLPLGLLATAGAVMMLKRNKANVVNNTEVAEVKQTPTPSSKPTPSQAKPSMTPEPMEVQTPVQKSTPKPTPTFKPEPTPQINRKTPAFPY